MNEREVPAETTYSEKYENVDDVPALGSGAQGVVILVKRRRDGKLLARKKIKHRECRYLERKCEFLENLSHANIIDFVACEHDRDFHFLYLEYCLYGDLLTFFSQSKNAVTENVLWQVVFQVASALAYCHHGVGIYGNQLKVEEKWDGIIHRDIKPDNVLISFWENGRIVVKICDFGVSKEYITTRFGTSVGTPVYREPDFSDGWSFKSDIFSLGRTTRALWGLNESLVISPKFEKVISKCEEKNRLQRFCAITLLHSIPAEYFHVPDGFQAKNSTYFHAEGPDISSFTGRLLATVANVGTETKRLRRLVRDLEGGEDLHSSYRNAIQYSLQHNYSTALWRICELLREMVNVTADDGKTPLHFAAETGRLRMVQELVELGADIGAISQDGWTALHLASKMGHLGVVEKLVHLGADITSSSQDGWTALHLAANSGHLEVVQKLVDLRADPTSTLRDGSTALHLAAQNGHLDVIQTLFDLGADPKSTSQDGSTALHFAAQNGHLEVVEKLVHLGADPRSTSQDGWTALHLTVKYGHLEVAQKILELELDLEILGYQRPEIHRSQPELRRRTPRKILSPGRSLKIP